MSAPISFERVAQDVRFAGRTLRRSPAFALVAIGTLGLAIGVTTALFTVVNAVLLRPLPFPDSNRLVMVWERSPGGNPANTIATPNYVDWRTENKTLEGIGAILQLPLNVTGLGNPEQVPGIAVTADFFRVLGVTPAVGRAIQPGEDRDGGAKTVVLSHAFWQQHFGESTDAVGQQISINGDKHEIVGVMPPGFAFPGSASQLFVALQIGGPWAPLGSGSRNLLAVARLRQTTTIEASRAEMERLAAQTARERPNMNAGWSATLSPLMEYAVGRVRPALLTLFGAVLCVLLIACANVANLLAMRAAGRTREMTVRVALGADRWRLVHQLTIESLLLATMGGAVGLLLAQFSIPGLVALFPATLPLPRAGEVGIDWRVLACAASLSLGAAMMVGLLPALHLNRDTARGGADSRSVTRSGRLRGALVVIEVTLAVVLVVAAGLMIRTLTQLYAVEPGFRAERVLTVQMFLVPHKNLEPSRRVAVLEHILDRVRGIPGVLAAGSIHFLPLSGAASGTGYYRLDRPVPAPGTTPTTDVSVVDQDYFRAMGIRLIGGRTFDAHDTLKSPRVALVNQAFAARAFPGEDPLGKRINVGWGGRHTGRDGPPEFEIVGVTANVRHGGLHLAPEPAVFLAHRQEPNFSASLVIRTAGDPTTMASAVRAAIRAVDPDQGVSSIRTMDAFVSDAVSRPRVVTQLLGAFGVLALAMACVGLYGVLAYAVEQRRREIGVRLAIGAAPRSILTMVVGEGLKLTAGGILIGLLAAAGLTRYLETLLFEVQPTDPAVLMGVSALLITVAAAAGLVPARRAMTVDPAIVLRDE